MPKRNDNSQAGTADHRRRKRLRGILAGKTGKAIGFTSIAAPVIGYVVNDLKKPDSIVRGLIGGVIRKLMPPKFEKVEAIDITDEVEIIENDSNGKN